MSKGRGAEQKVAESRDDWCTPVWILKLIREVFNSEIDFDPSGNPNSHVNATTEWWLKKHPLPIAPARNFVHVDDSLKESWSGFTKIFVNPPYSRYDNKAWAQKIWNTSCFNMHRSDFELVALVPANIETQWFDHYWDCTKICFFRGRLHFDGAADTADFASALVYYGKREHRFEETFKKHGRVIDGQGLWGGAKLEQIK